MAEDLERGSRATQLAFGLLAGLGAGLYIGWGWSYNAWTDIGLYTVTILLLLFGVTGFFLYTPKGDALDESGDE